MELYITCIEPLFIVTDLYLYGTVWNPNTQILVDQDLELYGTHMEPVTIFGLELYGTHINLLHPLTWKCMEPVWNPHIRSNKIITISDPELYGTCMEHVWNPTRISDLEAYGTCMEPLSKINCMEPN